MKVSIKNLFFSFFTNSTFENLKQWFAAPLEKKSTIDDLGFCGTACRFGLTFDVPAARAHGRTLPKEKKEKSSKFLSRTSG